MPRFTWLHSNMEGEGEGRGGQTWETGLGNQQGGTRSLLPWGTVLTPWAAHTKLISFRKTTSPFSPEEMERVKKINMQTSWTAWQVKSDCWPSISFTGLSPHTNVMTDSMWERKDRETVNRTMCECERRSLTPLTPKTWREIPPPYVKAWWLQ